MVIKLTLLPLGGLGVIDGDGLLCLSAIVKSSLNLLSAETSQIHVTSDVTCYTEQEAENPVVFKARNLYYEGPLSLR